MNGVQQRGVRVRYITEELRVGLGDAEGQPGDPEALWWAHPEWESRFPWLRQGTTSRGPGRGAGDFALFRHSGPPASGSHWTGLASSVGFRGIVHARQVHGSRVLIHKREPSGLVLAPDADGHLTARAGILMAVTVADCIPVFLVSGSGKGGGVLHAGWRGAAEGILETGVGMMVEEMGTDPGDLFLHLGPSICGECYEVGPEVHEALGLQAPPGPQPVDLRGVLADRAHSLGLASEHVTLSSHCTLCGDSPFFSHRGGDPQRQIGFLGFQSLPE